MPVQTRVSSIALAALIAAGVSTAVPSCADESVWPMPAWSPSGPADVRMDAGKLAEFCAVVGGRGCVVRHGQMAYSWGDITRRGDVASAAKTVYAHFALKAIEDGRIRALDAPVAEVEPRLSEVNPDLGHKDRGITWRQMLNQTACYGVREAPGTAFDYNDWHMALLWDTLFVKVYGAGMDTVDEQVLRPVLADVIGCEDAPTFMAFGPGDRPGRLAISPRDLARFGLLYLRGGAWEGRQLLSSEAVSLATTSPLSNSIPRTAGVEARMLSGQRSMGSRSVPDNQCDHLGSYSFLWWTNGVDRDGRRHWPNVPEDAYGAFGHGGPRAMVVIPSLDVVVSWNDAKVTDREAEGKALGLLCEACLDRDPMQGQIIVDPERPDALTRKGGGPFVMCGPGDPEGFLYRGTLRPDGTRDGDQLELIRELAATGANCLYLQVVRSHGGDGDATENPFVDHDPEKGLVDRLLSQWDEWFAAMDEVGICIYLFIYDDSARIWNTGDDVGEGERRLLRGLAERFSHHRNLIWCVAEEYEERFSAARVRAIARVLREADGNRHPIAVHKLNGLDFSELADDPDIDQFAIQYNVASAAELHAGLVKCRGEAAGRYSLNLAECAEMGTGSELRRKLWACAMAGAHVMVLRMDVASTPEEDLHACGRLVRFLEATGWHALAPHDELGLGDTEYVLAAPEEEYLVYSGHAEATLGLKDLPAGTYSLRWLDCATGREVWQQQVSLTGGAQTLDKPPALGEEVVVSLRLRR